MNTACFTYLAQTLRLAATPVAYGILTIWSSATNAQNITPTQEFQKKGVANYASYLDKDHAITTAATLEKALASKVLIQQVEVDGQTYLRLQSVAMDPVAAKSLIVRATAAGYPAWYQSAASARKSSASLAAMSNATAPKDTTSSTLNTARVNTIATPTQLTSANPKLVAMLPEGPLLGDLYPPRTPRAGR